MVLNCFKWQENCLTIRLHCDLCEDLMDEETQMHLLKCQFVTKRPEREQFISEIRYNDQAIKVWEKFL